jgi:hypothetical protein
VPAAPVRLVLYLQIYLSINWNRRTEQADLAGSDALQTYAYLSADWHICPRPLFRTDAIT